MIGYEDRTRIQLKVSNVFDSEYPNKEPIIASKIEQTFLLYERLSFKSGLHLFKKIFS